MGAALIPDLIVNGETVPQSVVAAEVQHHDAPKGKPGVAWRKAANAIAMRTLLLQEAQKRELKATPAEVGPGQFETEEEALIRGLLETSVSVEKPTEEDIQAEWARDPDRFRAPPLWEVSHILFACDPRIEAEKDKALARAKQVLLLVLNSKTPFSKIAAEYSDCGSKSSGGALGQLSPNDSVPEFEAGLRKLSDGEITPEPVLSRHGWHIIRMDGVATGQVLPFDSVKQHISDALEKAAWAQGARAFIDELVETASISGADLRAVPA